MASVKGIVYQDGLLTIQAASNKPTISGAHSDEAELCKALDNGFVPATEKERVMEGKTATCAKDKEIVTFACTYKYFVFSFF
ncbi:hypothetical protein D917_05935 [Trichinella nativa]|uniref:Uncharacterized protein n=1 Tax=Trichinella nativa TaxID=6335 RepID=A0A1Y3EYJ2_9BILA|nr:hypothetical protein D917_05935 [Trichinella nativa]